MNKEEHKKDSEDIHQDFENHEEEHKSEEKKETHKSDEKKHEKEEKLDDSKKEKEEHQEKHHSSHKVHAHKSDNIKHKIRQRLIKARRDKSIFIATTIFFAILSLILALMPKSSVEPTNVNEYIESLNEYSEFVTSDEAKAGIESAITSLESIKELVDDINIPGVGTDNATTPSELTGTTGGDFEAIIITDERCESCPALIGGVSSQLDSVFNGLTYKTLNYADEETKALMDKTGVTLLPSFLFTSDVESKEGYDQISRYLVERGSYLELRIGASFDPEAEICDNGLDDNGNGLIDCEDASCKSVWQCMEKKEKAEVEIFVMSHCPYGTQIEKGIIPVLDALGDDVDFELKFCDYAMHGEKELNEELNQYCIQKEQNDKLIPYLKCFLADSDSDSCLSEVEIDMNMLDACISATDTEFKVSENFVDKSTWKGNFPTFNIFKDDVDKYGVSGSPTLVINGVNVQANRDSASLLAAICTGFIDEPEACSSELSSASPSPGFGYDTTSEDTSAAQCG